jgi:zinc protease
MSSRLFILGLTVVLAIPAVPAHGQVARPGDLVYPKLPDFKVPKPARFVLPNGMVVMVMEDHELPLLSVVARVRTGSLLEPAEKTGLAGITGQVLRTGGTTTMKPDELDTFLEGKAASIETAIGADSGSASMSVLKADVADVMKVFADVLRRPAFDPDRLKVATTAASAAIARQNDNPSAILGRVSGQVIYGQDSPFARNPTYASIGSITRDDLVAWHKKYYHPNRIILGVVGDIRVDEARQLVTTYFGDWAKGPAVTEELPWPRKEPAPGVFEVAKADSTQSFVSVGHQGTLLRTNPDYFAVTVLNEVLSGSFTSRLFSKVRTELGLAYSVGGAVGSGWIRPSPFSATVSTKVESTVAATEALIKEIKDLQSARPPTDPEVELARSSILNSFVFNSDSAAEVLGQQMTYEYYGQPLDWLERYRAAIEKVTTAEVAAVSKKYLLPENFSIVVVGPKEGRDKPLDSLGPVKPVDVSIPELSSAKPSASESSPEAGKRGRALLDQALGALGGAAMVDGLTTYEEKGSLAMKGPQGDIELKTTVTVALPGRVRQDMQTPMGLMALVLTPEGAFALTPDGEKPLPPSMRERLEKELRHSPLLLLRHRNDPSFKASARGEGKAGSRGRVADSERFSRRQRRHAPVQDRLDLRRRAGPDLDRRDDPTQRARGREALRADEGG